MLRALSTSSTKVQILTQKLEEQGSYDFVVAFVAPPEPATFAQVAFCNAVACLWLFAGVVLMYEIREREHVAGKLKRF